VRTSIALCTYNGSPFIKAQLHSFLHQTQLPDELIVCDDGSQDETLHILEEYQHSAPFQVKIYQNETNLRVNKNFEKAIGLCSGDLIFLCDQDDVWFPTKIERFVAHFQQNPHLEAIFSNAIVTDENLQPTEGRSLWDKINFGNRQQKKWQNGKGVEVLLESNRVTGAALCIKPNLFKKALPFPYANDYLLHDGWLAMIAARDQSIGFLDDSLLYYRQHESQQVGLIKAHKTLKEKIFGNANERLQHILARKTQIDFLYQQFHDKAKIPAAQTDYLLKKSAHYAKRYEILNQPWYRRFGYVCNEILNGGYFAHNLKPWQAIIGDIIQK